MLASILRTLVDEKLTTVSEISKLCRRGESTVYRWLSGASQPDFDDMRQLVRRLANPEAKRRLVELFASGLPVKLEWMPEDDDKSDRYDLAGDLEALDMSLLALECLTNVIHQERTMLRERKIDEHAVSRTMQMIDDTIRHLTISKRRLIETIPPPKPPR
jgi:hypothetical protein